jgi:hypothetical protein
LKSKTKITTASRRNFLFFLLEDKVWNKIIY